MSMAASIELVDVSIFAFAQNLTKTWFLNKTQKLPSKVAFQAKSVLFNKS